MSEDKLAIPTPDPDDPAAIKVASTEQLWGLLTDGIKGWAHQLLRLSRIAAELISRGEELGQLRSGIGAYLPAIAIGAVLPETVVKFSGQPKLLKLLAQLPPGEQQSIIESGRVPVTVFQNNEYVTRMLPVHGLNTAQVEQVFGSGKIRSESEQIAAVTPALWHPRRKVTRGKVVVDRKGGTVKIGGATANAEDVIEALKVAGMIPT